MSKMCPRDQDARALVKRFCDHIFWLNQLHHIFLELFDDNRTQSLLDRTAAAFFQDLNKILADYFLLEVAKLTDPATSNRGRLENFTVDNMITTIDWPAECLQQLKDLNQFVQAFRKHIKPARHKILAHYDKPTVISNTLLGGYPEGEEEKALGALKQMCDLMHMAAFGEIFGDMVPYHLGDVSELKMALKKAIAFDELLSSSKGDDLRRLSDLLAGE